MAKWDHAKLIFDDSEVWQALLRKVDFGVHPDAEAAGFDKMTTIIEIALDDGTTFQGANGVTPASLA